MEGLPSGYRPNVGVCLINDDNMVFVASRLNVPGAWQMPQGGIEDSEDPRSAAIRELREETGVVSAEIIAERRCKAFTGCWGLVRWTGELRISSKKIVSRVASYTPMVTQIVPNWLSYDFPPAVKAKVNRLWGGEWHGQAQKWFLVRLTKDESEINLANGETDPEFSEWKWATPEEVVEQAVDYKRPTYEEVMRSFRPYLVGAGQATKCYSTKW